MLFGCFRRRIVLSQWPIVQHIWLRSRHPLFEPQLCRGLPGRVVVPELRLLQPEREVPCPRTSGQDWNILVSVEARLLLTQGGLHENKGVLRWKTQLYWNKFKLEVELSSNLDPFDLAIVIVMQMRTNIAHDIKATYEIDVKMAYYFFPIFLPHFSYKSFLQHSRICIQKTLKKAVKCIVCIQYQLAGPWTYWTFPKYRN